ncbi:Putative protein [Zobellia galactanivorans]|uniref:Uncharacterized protein n=1 Tax=Zobellia galactanivorans (strain DSM 12802 / CCUG 47099 / CIP 106680 / NCIMB 13871 / Dsij) TaxID=63186 RepID=G0LCP7_ZOBGA|nr:Putative protein [Zobellia galactanivorans]
MVFGELKNSRCVAVLKNEESTVLGSTCFRLKTLNLDKLFLRSITFIDGFLHLNRSCAANRK